MRPPTANPVTQGKHGNFNAVDYAANPDPVFYAPEDVTFHAYLLNAGDAGNNLQVRGATGLHGFCHLEESYIKPGESRRKGEPLGKMGYTGYTIPAGPAGRHLHWVIFRNGIYIYPPTLITEPFGGSQGGNEVNDKFQNEAEVKPFYVLLRGNEATLEERKGWVGRAKIDFINSPNTATEARNNAAERQNAIQQRDAARADANARQKAIDDLQRRLDEVRNSQPVSTGSAATADQLLGGEIVAAIRKIK